MLDSVSILLCELRDLPLPPSENALYSNLPGIGRQKTREFRSYVKEFDAWHWTHLKPLGLAKAQLRSKVELSLQIDFKFSHKSLYALSGAPKKIDVTNRLKCVIDLVCKALEIDDSRLFAVYCQKTASDNPGCTFRFFKHFPIPF